MVNKMTTTDREIFERYFTTNPDARCGDPDYAVVEDIVDLDGYYGFAVCLTGVYCYKGLFHDKTYPTNHVSRSRHDARVEKRQLAYEIISPRNLYGLASLYGLSLYEGRPENGIYAHRGNVERIAEFKKLLDDRDIEWSERPCGPWWLVMRR